MSQTAPVTYRPSLEQADAFFRDFFFNRTDLVASLDTSTEAKPIPLKIVDAKGKCIDEGTDPLTALVASHLFGRQAPPIDGKFTWKGGGKMLYGPFRIGTYAPAEDNTTRWLCIDFDGKGHADALKDALGEARKTMAAAAAANIHAYLERSGGAAGYHVWIFFQPAVQAATAKRIGQWLVPRDALYADGRQVDPKGNKGIEVFPKQAVHRGTKATGNMVWLPWWAGAMATGNVFYRDAADGRVDKEGRLELDPYLPDNFLPLNSADVERVTKLLDEQDAQTAAERAVQAKDQEAEATAANESPDSCDATVKDRYETWKRVAISSIHLEVIYGDILTGNNKSGGWLEARDPTSPTGDQSPSAGVADGSGEARRGTYHSFITGESLDIFAYLQRYRGFPNFMAAARHLAEVSGVPLPPPRSADRTRQQRDRDVEAGVDGKSYTPQAPKDNRPEVNVYNVGLLEVTLATWSAVRQANARTPERPTVFRSNFVMVDLAPTDRGPRIRYMNHGDVMSMSNRVANYVRVTEKATVPGQPSHDVYTMMMNRTDPALSCLDEVITTPVFDQQGNLVAEPGYHRDAKVWYHRPQGFDFDSSSVPVNPTADDVAAARALLVDELLHDFPFATTSDLCHAVSAIILPFARRMITGNTPLHLLEAPTAGSGKGLLADVISTIAVGQTCAVTTLSKNEEETEKKITAVLIKGAAVNLIDNVTELRSPTLASSITAQTWSGRILGISKMAELPNRAVWLITGNNPSISQEIARRCVRIRIDPKVEAPWRRSDFKHNPLLAWVRQERAALVRAVIILIRAWISVGKPDGKVRLGSFDEYAGVMSGLLSVAGIPGFLENSDELYAATDDESVTWREFFTAMVDEYKVGRFVGTKTLRDFCINHNLLLEHMGDKSEKGQIIKLGRALNAARDRQFGGLVMRARVRSERGGAREYAVFKSEDESSSGWAGGRTVEQTSMFASPGKSNGGAETTPHFSGTPSTTPATGAPPPIDIMSDSHLDGVDPGGNSDSGNEKNDMTQCDDEPTYDQN